MLFVSVSSQRMASLQYSQNVTSESLENMSFLDCFIAFTITCLFFSLLSLPGHEYLPFPHFESWGRARKAAGIVIHIWCMSFNNQPFITGVKHLHEGEEQHRACSMSTVAWLMAWHASRSCRCVHVQQTCWGEWTITIFRYEGPYNWVHCRCVEFNYLCRRIMWNLSMIIWSALYL